MVQSYARNKVCMDKHDFMSMLAGDSPRKIRQLRKSRK
jgi:hypothetical protein